VFNELRSRLQAALQIEPASPQGQEVGCLLSEALDLLKDRRDGSHRSVPDIGDFLRLLELAEQKHAELLALNETSRERLLTYEQKQAELVASNETSRERLLTYELALTRHETGPHDPEHPKAASGAPVTIGINNLAKLNEEALFDALTFFKKLCPCCGGHIYRAGIRQKIEIDRFDQFLEEDR